MIIKNREKIDMIQCMIQVIFVSFHVINVSIALFV